MFQIFWKLFCVNFFNLFVNLLLLSVFVCGDFLLILWYNWCVVSEMTKTAALLCGCSAAERVGEGVAETNYICLGEDEMRFNVIVMSSALFHNPAKSERCSMFN